jgi:gamma-glutamyl hercynylcysteine S-oxide synthase
MVGIPMGPSTRTARYGLSQGLSEARAQSDALFEIIRPEAFYERPIPERHRIIFYLGHLEAFDWNLFGRELPGLKPFAPGFDQLFAFGIDPVNGGLPDDQPEDWPKRDEVLRYVQSLRTALSDELANALEGADEGRQRTLSQYVNVAIEHRLMHVETLAYMLHRLPINLKRSRPGMPPPRAPQVRPQMTAIPAGIATLGMKREEEGPFGWDNEFGEHSVFVPEFRIDTYKVTNFQYLRFVAEGGYGEKSFWSEAAWQWLQSSGTLHPAFWTRRGSQFFVRTMFDEVPLPLDWPVYASHAEAWAYARWAGKELPTEAEWHRAAYGAYNGAERAYPWGDEPPAPSLGNFDFQYWDPSPVAAFPAGSSAFGVTDLVGNGWEWTRTVFAPFEGFEAFSFYPGYSANFFDNEHYVMKGGSARTAACLLRRSFRNWFQPLYPYIYAGFRCVER